MPVIAGHFAVFLSIFQQKYVARQLLFVEKVHAA
jgi:hypothetical protein